MSLYKLDLVYLIIEAMTKFTNDIFLIKESHINHHVVYVVRLNVIEWNKKKHSGVYKNFSGDNHTKNCT